MKCRGISVAQSCAGGTVVHKRLAIVLTATLCPAAGWTAGAWHASMADNARRELLLRHLAETPLEPTGPDWSALPTPLIDEPPPSEDRRDLYGNDVSPAIARYSHDAAGSVREEHSPATEVARLKPPTT